MSRLASLGRKGSRNSRRIEGRIGPVEKWYQNWVHKAQRWFQRAGKLEVEKRTRSAGAGSWSSGGQGSGKRATHCPLHTQAGSLRTVRTVCSLVGGLGWGRRPWGERQSASQQRSTQPPDLLFDLGSPICPFPVPGLCPPVCSECKAWYLARSRCSTEGLMPIIRANTAVLVRKDLEGSRLCPK